MALTHSDIVWYNCVYDGVMIIDSCGDFPNVPLLGTKGGINYNPVLACRQFGYAMRGKPNNIRLSTFYLKENEDNRDFKEKIVCAWYNIRRKGREELGRKCCFSLEPYLQWVQARALDLKMLYPRQEPLHVTDKCPTLVFLTDVEKLQIALTKMQKERDSWKNKYQIVEFENSEIQKLLKQRDEEDSSNKKRKAQVDLFSSSPILPADYSNVPATSGVWKSIIDNIMLGKRKMKEEYKEKIGKLEKILWSTVGSFSDVVP